MNNSKPLERDKIACVVLNWNGGQNAVNCVRSLLASKGVNTDILMVDNGSSDGSEALLRDRFPQLSILRNEENLGVAKAWNIGVEWAMHRGRSYIFFLNDDAVIDAACLTTLSQVLAENPQVGIATPRILDGKNFNKIWFDGGFANWFGGMVHRNFAKEPTGESKPFAEDFATGCAMLVRTEVFKQAGLFDESYFAYSEDADFCLRSRAKGFVIIHNPTALATHYPSAATIENKGKWFRDYYVTRNSLMLGRRHWSGMRRIIFFGYSVVIVFFAPVIYFSLTGQFRRVWALVQGVVDFVLRKDGKRYG